MLSFGAPSVTELLAGNADVLEEVGEADLLKIERDHRDRFRVRHMISRSAVNAILWNHRRPQFADRMVRHALTMAIDRRELTRLLNLPPATPVLDGFMTEGWRALRDVPTPIPYDPDRASEMPSEAGVV